MRGMARGYAAGDSRGPGWREIAGTLGQLQAGRQAGSGMACSRATPNISDCRATWYYAHNPPDLFRASLVDQQPQRYRIERNELIKRLLADKMRDVWLNSGRRSPPSLTAVRHYAHNPPDLFRASLVDQQPQRYRIERNELIKRLLADKMRDVWLNSGRRSPPHPRTSRPEREGPTGKAHMGTTHGGARTQDPRGLPDRVTWTSSTGASNPHKQQSVVLRP